MTAVNVVVTNPDEGVATLEAGFTYVAGRQFTVSAQESGADTASLALSVASSLTITGQETGDDSASLSLAVSPIGGFTLTAQESGSDTASLSLSVANSFELAAQEQGTDTASVFIGTPLGLEIAATESGSDTAQIFAFTLSRQITIDGQESGSDSAVIRIVDPPKLGRINRDRPRYRNTDISALVRAADRKPDVIPTYEFSGRTFYKERA